MTALPLGVWVQGRGKGCLSVLSFPASNRQMRRFEKTVSFFSTPTSLTTIFSQGPFTGVKGVNKLLNPPPTFLFFFNECEI